MILEKFPIILRPPTVISNTIIHTEKQFLEFVNKFNGKKDIFVNLYYYTKSGCCSSFFYFDESNEKYICSKCKKVIERLDLTSFIIDSVVFDLDPKPITFKNKQKEWMKAKKFWRHFKDYERYIVKSGKGFHFYVRTIPLREKDFVFGAKNAIKNFQIQTEKTLGATDWITHGDTSQMIRVPGTYNVRSGLFCLTLELENLKLVYKELDKLAEQQPLMKMKAISEGKRLDLREYDEKISEEDFIHEGELVTDFDLSEDEMENIIKILKSYHVNYDKLAQCVRTMMGNNFLDWRQRFLLINIMKNLGLSEQDTEKLMSVVLWTEPDPKNPDERKRYNWAEHCIQKERQIYYIYHKSYGIPSCKSGRNLGFQILGLCDDCESQNIMRFR